MSVVGSPRASFVPVLLDANGKQVWKGTAAAEEALALQVAEAEAARLSGLPLTASTRKLSAGGELLVERAASAPSSGLYGPPGSDVPGAVGEEGVALRERLLRLYGEPPLSIRERAEYPSNSERIEVRVPNHVRNGGGLIGYIYPSGAFLKVIKPEHLVVSPPAVAYDSSVLDAYRGRLRFLVVYVRDRKLWLATDFPTFDRHAVVLANRGRSGLQRGLPLAFWPVAVSLS